MGAEWCPPCKALAPELDKLAKSHTNIVFVSIDVDEFCPMTDVSGIPDTRFIKNGNELTKIVGYNMDAINDAITKYGN